MGHKLAAQYRHKARHASPIVIIEPPAIVKRARTDLEAFGQYVCHKIAADVHKKWFGPLKDKDIPYLNILAPRGSAKSTWCAIDCAHNIGQDPTHQIIYTGYSESVALKQSRIIKRIIESPRYKEVFPEVRPSRRWSDVDWEIDKAFAGVSNLDSDYTFYAVGVNGSITSRRSTLIYFDDLIRSSKSIANPEIRETMLTNIEEVILPTLIPVSAGGRVRSIGTRFRRDDIHALNFIPAHGWQTIETSAIQPDGSSYWPDRFPVADLERIQLRSPVTFAYQYQNVIPPADEEAIIKQDWIKYGDCPAQFDDLVLGVDLAATEKERADWTAFVLIGRKGDHFYIVRTWRFRDAGNLDKIERIKDIQKQYNQRFKVVVEKGGYQNSFEGDWKVAVKKWRSLQSVICEPSPLKSNVDKDSKLKSISGVFANGLVILNRNQPMNHLVEELLRLTFEHDDLADACVHAIARLQRRSRRPLSSAG